MYGVVEYFNIEDCFFKPIPYVDKIDKEVNISGKYPKMFHLVNMDNWYTRCEIFNNAQELIKFCNEYKFKIVGID